MQNFKKLFLIFVLFIPALVFGYWKKHKIHNPSYTYNIQINNNGDNPDVTDSDDNGGILDAEDPDDNNDNTPDEQETDTDGDGYADDIETKVGSDPLDATSTPDLEKIKMRRKIEENIRLGIKAEISKFGCDWVWGKYIERKEVPKAYPSKHNWNEWSKFDIKEFKNLIQECKLK